MSDDLVKQSIAELQDLVRCRCHDAYKGRGLHDPTCCCDYAEALKAVSDRIEELEVERDDYAHKLMQANNTYTEMHLEIERLSGKLAKAEELAEKSIKWLRLYGADVHREAATLKELTGSKDE